jgi:hypothetical protein
LLKQFSLWVLYTQPRSQNRETYVSSDLWTAYSQADYCWSPEEELLLLLHPTQIALVKGASRLITNDLMQTVRINKDHSLTLESVGLGIEKKIGKKMQTVQHTL